MKKSNKMRLGTDQRGFAALIIALILVIVLGLISVGFAELMRHSQTQALNRQLSDQAFYAAESGINDALEAINDPSGGFDIAKNTCPPLTSAPVGLTNSSWEYMSNNTVGTGSNAAQWTCLLIDPTPGSLIYDSVDTTTPTVLTVSAVDSSGAPASLNSMTFSWQGSDPTNTNFRGSPCSNSNICFPPATGPSPIWGSIGMVRLTITPLTDYSRAGLVDNTYTAYLYPCGSSPNCESETGGYSPNTGFSSGNGPVLNGGCSTSNTPACHATISGFSGFSSSTKYLISLRSIYGTTSVQITGVNTTGAPVSFAGTQTMIDSTGRALNVLKRLQVRVPIGGATLPYPGFLAEGTGSICKQLTDYPGNVTMTAGNNCP